MCAVKRAGPLPLQKRPDLLPLVGGHNAFRGAISCASQLRANVQHRATVRSEQAIRSATSLYSETLEHAHFDDGPQLRVDLPEAGAIRVPVEEFHPRSALSQPASSEDARAE